LAWLGLGEHFAHTATGPSWQLLTWQRQLRNHHSIYLNWVLRLQHVMYYAGPEIYTQSGRLVKKRQMAILALKTRVHGDTQGLHAPGPFLVGLLHHITSTCGWCCWGSARDVADSIIKTLHTGPHSSLFTSLEAMAAGLGKQHRLSNIANGQSFVPA